MTNTLTSPQTASLLDRLYAEAAKRDPAVLARIQTEVATKMGGVRDYTKLAPFYDQALLPVAPEVGRLFYVLTRARRPKTIVELGTSFGISAIHYASALRDNGAGRMITTEMSQSKAVQAKENIAAAGLSDLIELRLGDAFETLKTLNEKIDLLFLDNWKEHYFPMLKFLEPKLAPGALIIADDLNLYPERLADYVAYVRDPESGYVSVNVPLDHGVELSMRG